MSFVIKWLKVSILEFLEGLIAGLVINLIFQKLYEQFDENFECKSTTGIILFFQIVMTSWIGYQLRKLNKKVSKLTNNWYPSLKKPVNGDGMPDLPGPLTLPIALWYFQPVLWQRLDFVFGLPFQKKK
tara:strand:+ start:1114 stop:1497 length:384 start_codon:yes stop_codon:yes gene_type:complete